VRCEALSDNAHEEAVASTVRWHSPQNAKADPAGGRQGATNRLKPGEQGATRWHPVTALGPKPEFDYGYARNPCLKRPHLERTTK
jgi:hypothetical protein